MREWDQLSEREQLESIYSDAYKDAYGFRPRGHVFDTVEELQAAIERCSAEIELRIAEEKESMRRAMLEFEARVASVIETGAADRATALRWIADADGCADDLEHLCYVNGLPFSYFDKEVS